MPRMIAVVENAETAERLTLLRAHPDLGTRARVSRCVRHRTDRRGTRSTDAVRIRSSESHERGLS